MLKILRIRFKQGCRAILFPKAPAPALPERYRGRPIIAGQTTACNAAGQKGSVDLGVISFNPDSDIVYSNDYQMAVSQREDLVLSQDHTMVLARALNDQMLKIFGRS